MNLVVAIAKKMKKMISFSDISVVMCLLAYFTDDVRKPQYCLLFGLAAWLMSYPQADS
jgi:hypothetical protein